jgi:hypothetical protein
VSGPLLRSRNCSKTVLRVGLVSRVVLLLSRRLFHHFRAIFVKTVLTVRLHETQHLTSEQPNGECARDSVDS